MKKGLCQSKLSSPGLVLDVSVQGVCVKSKARDIGIESAR